MLIAEGEASVDIDLVLWFCGIGRSTIADIWQSPKVPVILARSQ